MIIPIIYFSQKTASSPAVDSVKPQLSIKSTRIGERKERVDSKQNTEQNIIEPNVGKVLDTLRVAQIRHLCNEGMLLTQRIPRNDVVVDPATLKTFIRKANLWQAEQNNKSEGGPELSVWLSHNTSNPLKAAQLIAKYWESEVYELLDNTSTRNLMLSYLQDLFASSDWHSYSNFWGDAGDLDKFYTETFGQQSESHPPLAWWLITLNHYITNRHSDSLAEPPLPEGIEPVMASFLRDKVQCR